MLTDLIVAALATWEIIEIWHHSSVFAGRRARVELREDRLGELLMCPFCLAPWVAWLVTFSLLGARHLLDPVTGWISVLPFYGFAVARLANLGNDLTHAWCRTPRTNKEIPAQRDDPKTTFEEGIKLP